MYKFICYGWRSYAPWEEIDGFPKEYHFMACVLADSLRAAHNLAASLAPSECNRFSAMFLPVARQ